MIDLLKELVKEPESAKKYAIILLKFIIISIVTSKIYVSFFGQYKPILIGDANFWHDIYNFIINGKVLIVAFIFFGLKLIVFELLTTIVYSIIYFITSRIKKNKSTFRDSNFFRGLLILFSVINHNKEKNVLETGRNFDFIYPFITNYQKEDILDAFDKFKHSYLYEFFNIYCFFTVVYFFFMDYNYSIISVLIIIGLLLITYIICTFQYIYETIISNYDELVVSLKTLKQIDVSKKILLENNIKIKNELNKIFVNFIKFEINNIEFGIEHFLGNKLVSESIKESNLPNDSKLILITSRKLPKLLELNLKTNSKIIIIEFNKDENELIQKLEEVLFSERKKIEQ